LATFFGACAMNSRTTLRHALVLVVVIAGCDKTDKNPTPLPHGAPQIDASIASPYVMLGAGDIAICGDSGASATSRLVDSVLRVDSAQHLTSVVFTLGDNAYPSDGVGANEDFQRCFATSWGKKDILDVIRPAPGNHDYDSGSGAPYFSYFGARAGPQGKGYYSYDVGSWHLVSLNSELYFVASDAAQHDQENWLRADLASHPSKCTLAYFHRPLFSSGTYGATPEVRPLWDILYAANADLVLNGHEHHYERFRPQSPTGAADSARGIEEIIAGTGGAELRQIRHPLAANSIVQIHGRHGILKLELGDGRYSHVFIEATGRLWDPAQGRCH
jgi:calcineurin-like phosphoesterase family protein